LVWAKGVRTPGGTRRQDNSGKQLEHGFTGLGAMLPGTACQADGDDPPAPASRSEVHGKFFA